MGWKSSTLPDSLLRRIPATERKPLGKAGVTNAEAQAKAEARDERELQNQMEALLRQRDIFFDRSRMDRRTTRRKGMPDFFIVFKGGNVLFVEAKTQTGDLSADQVEMFAEIIKLTGEPVRIVRDLHTFRALLDSHGPNPTT